MSNQRGKATIAGSATTVTLTAGTDYTAPADATKAFIRITGVNALGAGTVSTAGANQNMAYITNPSNIATSINIARHTTSAETLDVTWEIMDFNDWPSSHAVVVRAVQVLQIATTVTSVNGSVVSGISNDADVVVVITGQKTGSGSTGASHRGQHTAAWDSANDYATLTRGAVGASIQSDLSIAVLEFTGSAWAVQRVDHTYTAGGATQTETITTLGAVDQAFLFHQIRTDSGSAVASNAARAWISGVSELSLFTGTLGTNQHSVVWIVEDTTGALVVEQLSGSQSSGGSEPETFTKTITTLSDATLAFIAGEGLSGTSMTDTSDHCLAMNITDASTVSLYRGDTSQAVDYRFQVVDLNALLGAGDYTITGSLAINLALAAAMAFTAAVVIDFAALRDEAGNLITDDVLYEWYPDSEGTGAQEPGNLNAAVETDTLPITSGVMTITGITSGDGWLYLFYYDAGSAAWQLSGGRYTAS